MTSNHQHALNLPTILAKTLKFKRKSDHDNWRLRIRHLGRMGLAFMLDYLKPTEG